MSLISNQVYIILLIFGVFLSPWLPIIPGAPKVRFDDIFIFLYIVDKFIFNKIIVANSIRIVCLALLSIVFVHLLLAVINQGSDLASVLFSQYKYLKYFIIAIIFSKLKDSQEFEIVNKFILYSVIFNLGVCVLQILDVDYFGRYFIELYSVSNEQALQLTDESIDLFKKRAIGSMGNPNSLATAAMFLAIYFIHIWNLSGKKLWAFGAGVCFITLLLSMSRMGIILAIFGVVFYLRGDLIRKSMAAIITTFVFVAVLFVFSYDKINDLTSNIYLFERFSEVGENGSGSVSSRVNNKWPELLRMAEDSIFIGHGVTPEVQGGSVDSELLEDYYQYGLVGLAFSLFLFLSFLIGFNYLSNFRTGLNGILSHRLLMLFSIFGFVTSLFASLLTNTQLGAIYFLLISLITAARNGFKK